MDIDQLIGNTKAILYALFIISIICMVIRFFIMEYRLYKRDQAEIETAPAIAYYKHPDMEPFLAGRGSTWIYYITFHTDSGDILKLYLNPDQFHAVAEGSRGLLTWQGTRFWKFEQEEPHA